MSKLRSDAIRLASTFPKDSVERKQIIAAIKSANQVKRITGQMWNTRVFRSTVPANGPATEFVRVVANEIDRLKAVAKDYAAYVQKVVGVRATLDQPDVTSENDNIILELVVDHDGDNPAWETTPFDGEFDRIMNTHGFHIVD